MVVWSVVDFVFDTIYHNIHDSTFFNDYFSSILFSFNKMQFRLSKGAFLFVYLFFLYIKNNIFRFDDFTIDQVYIDVAYHSFKILTFLDIETMLFGVGGLVKIIKKY